MASSQTPPHAPAPRPAIEHVPYSLRVAAAWGWRLIVVGVIVATLATVFSSLATILLPMIIALLIAAPLERVVTRLEALRVPRGLGAVIAILGLLSVFVGLSIAAGAAIVNGFEQLRRGALQGFEELLEWLTNEPLNLSREQLDTGIENIGEQVQANAWGLASGALSVTGVVGGMVAGIIISMLALFFFLRDGRTMWAWIAGLVPGDEASARVERAGMGAWRTLRRYTQTSVFVAFIDAVGIGLVAWILGVPLALPIAILTFVTAFIPLFGATIAGLVATLIALVDGGWTTAALMLAGILVVQQIEGNVLYPWLFGKAAQIHPFVILMTISAGTLTAGLVGAVIAVPILAFLYTFIRGLRGEYTRADEVEDATPITSKIPIVAKRGRDAIAHAISKTGEIRIHQDKKSPPSKANPRDNS
ncbi:MAG: AI-2E family transporter [Actinobacteria bacterium HGW-Actinobacteria-4]|nr:MAG: AI-2E family transporter [Actinobacteria bacterium HGW-Actinobacteria-4]